MDILMMPLCGPIAAKFVQNNFPVWTFILKFSQKLQTNMN